MATPGPGRTGDTTGSRAEQKEKTRRKIIRAALELVEKQGFDAMSLREVARKVGISPAAFYRHFDSMDALGLELVEESFDSIGPVIGMIRAEIDSDDLIDGATDALIDAVLSNRRHFRFIARERHGGARAIRDAIADQLRGFTEDVAINLEEGVGLTGWHHRELTHVADLFVTIMVEVAAQVLDDPDRDLAPLKHRTKEQLRVFSLGIAVRQAQLTGNA